MKYAVVNQLLSKDVTKKSHKIQVIVMDGKIESDRFTIPVVDVRDGPAERGYANTSLKSAAPQSKFIRPSFSVIGKSYQASHKKD